MTLQDVVGYPVHCVLTTGVLAVCMGFVSDVIFAQPCAIQRQKEEPGASSTFIDSFQSLLDFSPYPLYSTS